jgi:hypothetical protein
MKNIQIRLILLIICFLLTNCSSKNFVIYNAIKGIVLSSEDSKPIKNVKIYVIKGCSNDFGSMNTKENGTFFIDGLKLPYKYLHDQQNLSYNYFIEKSGYKKKSIYVKKLNETKSNALDTIDLGIIYLDPDK